MPRVYSIPSHTLSRTLCISRPGQMAPVRVHEYNEIVWRRRTRSRRRTNTHTRVVVVLLLLVVVVGGDDDIIIMKHVISQSVNCTESKDGWACPGKSDAASNIPEGVVKPPEWGTPRSFINGY